MLQRRKESASGKKACTVHNNKPTQGSERFKHYQHDVKRIQSSINKEIEEKNNCANERRSHGKTKTM